MHAKAAMRLNAARGFIEEGFLDAAEVIGVGTGSTITTLIEMLPDDVIRSKTFAASSLDTLLKLKRRGAKLLEPSGVDEFDVYVDGADAYDDELNLVKGGGAAHFREKVMALQSKRFIVVADETKYSVNLLKLPIPIEVHPIALPFVLRELKKLGLEARVREAVGGKWGPVVSDTGGVLVDIDARSWQGSLDQLHQALKLTPGVVETGLFLRMAEAVVVGKVAGYSVLRRRSMG